MLTRAPNLLLGATSALATGSIGNHHHPNAYGMPRGARGMRSAFRAAAGVHRLPCGWDWFDAARRATLCSRPGSSVLPDVLRCSSKQGSLRGGEWPSAEHHLLAHAPMAFDPIATTASTLPDTSAAFFSHAPSPCLAKPALYDFHTDFH